MKQLTDKVVVITGASSGIGRSSALEFARAGAKVVLAARDKASLLEVQRECADIGAHAISVECDVINEPQVEHVCAQAIEAFGHIDVWVNNAGVNLFATFDATPADDFRRIIETNFFGYVYGTRAALRHFRNQRSGTLINVDAVEGLVPAAYNSAYTASKHAVRALASSLRMELLLDKLPEIHVCTVIPGAVDTPMLAHAANYSRHELRAPSTAVSATAVAKAITKLAVKPQREVLVGAVPRLRSFGYGLVPTAYERRSRQFVTQDAPDTSSVPAFSGNLYQATDPHSEDGGWRNMNRPRRLRSLAAPLIVLLTSLLAISALAAALSDASLASRRKQFQSMFAKQP